MFKTIKLLRDSEETKGVKEFIIEDRRDCISYSSDYFERFYGRAYSRLRQTIRTEYLSVLHHAAKYWDTIMHGRNKKALDVGCAYGYGLEVLLNLGYETYGIDVSDYAIERAKLLHKNIQNNIVVHDIHKPVPFKTKFDLITCLSTFEHLQQPEVALKNCYNALENESILIVTTPNKLCIFNFIRKDPTEINIKTSKQWRKIFLNLGFKAIIISTGQYIPFIWRIAKSSTFISYPLGSSIRIFAKKGQK
jgi:2-polyprenyl-3-methyl-5-hydroxy-6-metoxy-1,4-benzoquinol methylase